MITAGNSQLEVWDSGSGPSLLFIHGVGTSGQTWNSDLADLAADFRLIVYNRRGYGVPVTIVDAALSPSFLRRSSHRLKQMLPRAHTVTLERSGHWVALDAHDELLATLRDAAHV